MFRFDTIVLGGGIIGAATAEELARRGQRVALLERGVIGGEASTAAAGILSSQMDVPRPGPFLELCQASHRLYPAWTARIERASGIPVGFHRDGILHLTLSARTTQQMDRRIRWQRALGLRAERWSVAETRRHEPNLTSNFTAGYWFPAEGQVDNAALMRALAMACRRAGVSIFERTEAVELLTRRGAAIGVRATSRTFRAPAVVNSLGSWAGIQGMRPSPIPVRPARGQILSFEAPKRFFRRAVMSDASYGVQRRDGRLLVGSTIEFVGFDRRVTLDGMSSILAGFERIVRREALERCILRDFWAGLRPFSATHNPILGRSRIGGLFHATGHFRHGVLLAPVTAKLLSQLILDEMTSYPIAPFAPTRL